MPITPSPAVLRAGDILAHMLEHPEYAFTVSELSRTVDMPRATCDAILQALEQHRLVTRLDEDRRFELGPMSIALGDAARIANPALRAAAREAESLARELGGCIAVCVRDAETARIVDVYDFGPLFAVRARVGQSIPLVPPFGAVFVAWSRDDADAWIAAAGDILADQERERYRHALEEVRRRGYSVAIAQPRESETPRALETLLGTGEEGLGHARNEAIRQMAHSGYLPEKLEEHERIRLRQISVPIFERNSRVRTSLLMAGPDHDVSISEIHSVADRLLRAAQEATRKIGGREPTS